MGNLFSVSISPGDIASAHCWDYIAGLAKYTHELDKSLDALKAALEELRELRNDLRRRVDLAEEQQLRPLDQVQGWLSRVEAMMSEAEELLKAGPREIEKLCIGRCCSRSFKSSYKFGKKVAKSLKNVADLKSKGVFDVVAERLPTPQVTERPSEQTVGLDSRFDKVWSCFLDENVGIIGLYGMGGVGKTTLLTQINNNFLLTPTSFDFVIWVLVSKELQLERIQEDVGRKIGLSDGLWKNKWPDEKAIDIFKILSKKKFVLLLDDLWERVDLTKVGIPLPGSQNGSKVVFTTRSEEVCGCMEAQRIIKIECLAWDDAWELFQKKVGENALYIHPDIPKLARIVAKECCGLPLAIITIARAMACKKTPQEWHHSINVLKKSASEFSGLVDEVFPLLKFSYDNLPNHNVRSCFLYCALFPEDYSINKIDLIDYWIGEGILDGYEDRDAAENHGFVFIGTLIHACLLEDEGDCVKMHGVVHDMALWIACEFEEVKMLVQAGRRLNKAPDPRKWKEAKRVSLMDNQIQTLTETPMCYDLVSLFLNSNCLIMTTGSFFQFMPSLKVLDLSNNEDINELPLGISELVSLQYLNLSRTNIKELQEELKNMANLKYLNLEYNIELVKIPQQVISSFSALQVLRMFNCGSSDRVVEGSVLSGDNEALVEELKCLKELNVLSIDLKSSSALQRILQLPELKSCTQALSLQHFRGSKSLNVSELKSMRHLRELGLTDCLSLEELKISWAEEGGNMAEPNNLPDSITTASRYSQCLCRVVIKNCPKLEDLTWLALSPNLTYLSVSVCFTMKDLISHEKSVQVQHTIGNDLNPFSKLKVMELFYLPQLKSIYWNCLPLPCLKEITIHQCPNLKKLPLNSSSAKENKIVIQGQEEWWNELEWEDETTKNIFLPCFKI